MSIFKKLNTMFTRQKPDPVPQPPQNFQARFINFANPSIPKEQEKKVIKMSAENESEIRIESYEQAIDARYENLQKLPSLKELGLKKDEIWDGQIPIMVESKFVFCKMSDMKYEEVSLIETNYKLCIRPINTGEFSFFPLGKIDKLHKYTNNENAFKLLIVLKDGRNFKFRINSEVSWRKIYDKIENFAFVRVKSHFFAFKHFEANPSLEQKHRGWQLYDPEREFERMGISLMKHTEDPIANFTSDFKILDNKDGKICTTYQRTMIVPSRMPYDYLVRCSKFRSRSRMPAMTYAYQYSQGKFSCIYRSSQSKVGVQNSRCAEDEIMLRMIGDHTFNLKDETAHVGAANCKIYDARNYIAALGNKFSGKGYESTEFYRNIEIDFLNIPNIHAVRQAYNKVLKASFGEDLKFHVALAQSQWYDYVFLILSGAVEIAKNLTKGINNLIHCSDGWDRTAQLSAIASLILDPYYRTMEGFQILIQKDWIHFGHQFGVRLGQGTNNPSGDDKSQVFLQFLDCVSQIMYQFPSDFEFNYRYLQDVGEFAYSHLFGNFLCNCELEMEKMGVPRKTVSLWSYTAEHKSSYLNPFFVPGPPDRILELSSAQKNMRFWKQHFLQFVDGFRDVYDIYSCKFTQDNLEIMHRQLRKEKLLLLERLNDNDDMIRELDGDILKRTQVDS